MLDEILDCEIEGVRKELLDISDLVEEELPTTYDPSLIVKKVIEPEKSIT